MQSTEVKSKNKPTKALIMSDHDLLSGSFYTFGITAFKVPDSRLFKNM